MKDAFTDKGVPVKLITDGGPQFSSRVFKQFKSLRWLGDYARAEQPSLPAG